MTAHIIKKRVVSTRVEAIYQFQKGHMSTITIGTAYGTRRRWTFSTKCKYIYCMFKIYIYIYIVCLKYINIKLYGLTKLALVLLRASLNIGSIWNLNTTHFYRLTWKTSLLNSCDEVRHLLDKKIWNICHNIVREEGVSIGNQDGTDSARQVFRFFELFRRNTGLSLTKPLIL